MSVEIWLSFNNTLETIQLPVNPAELSVKMGSANESVSVQRLGQVSIIQDPVLKTFEFSSQFPKNYGPYCEYWLIPDPQKTVEVLEGWKNSGFPIQFTVINGKDTIWDLPVTIESFNVKEIAGDVGTLYYDLSLQEYKYVQARTVETKTENGQTKAKVSKKGKRSNPRMKPKSYTVKAGDNLWTIGRKVGVDYQIIAEANHLKPPYTIKPNQVLMIP